MFWPSSCNIAKFITSRNFLFCGICYIIISSDKRDCIIPSFSVCLYCISFSHYTALIAKTPILCWIGGKTRHSYLDLWSYEETIFLITKYDGGFSVDVFYKVDKKIIFSNFLMLKTWMDVVLSQILSLHPFTWSCALLSSFNFLHESDFHHWTIQHWISGINPNWSSIFFFMNCLINSDNILLRCFYVH